MLEISDYIVNKIENDSTIKTLLGSTSKDSRVYPYRVPFKVEWSASKIGAIFWKSNHISPPKTITDMVQIGNIYFYFQCVSTSFTLSKQIEERLFNLFDDPKNLGFSTTNYRIGVVLDNGGIDGPDEGTPKFPLPSRVYSIVLENIFKKT